MIFYVYPSISILNSPYNEKIKGAKNMKTIQELEQEYNEFKVKVLKASNDFANEINKLSPENRERFKNEMLNILPVGIVDLIRQLTN